MLHRDHCWPDPNWTARPGGEPWSTIKPLQTHGCDLSRTLLVDNEAWKAADGEDERTLYSCTGLSTLMPPYCRRAQHVFT